MADSPLSEVDQIRDRMRIEIEGRDAEIERLRRVLDHARAGIIARRDEELATCESVASIPTYSQAAKRRYISKHRSAANAFARALELLEDGMRTVGKP